MAAIDRETGIAVQDKMTADTQHQIDEGIRNQLTDHRYGVVASGGTQPCMRSAGLEFKADSKHGEHQTDKSEDARQNSADQIDGVIAPRVRHHMSLDGERLDAMHDNIVRQTLLTEHLALESTGGEVRHREQLLIRRVAAYRIGIGDIEIQLRSLERHEVAVEAFADDEDSVNLTLLHRFAGLRIGVGDQLYIHRRRSLHLMDEAA